MVREMNTQTSQLHMAASDMMRSTKRDAHYSQAVMLVGEWQKYTDSRGENETGDYSWLNEREYLRIELHKMSGVIMANETVMIASETDRGGLGKTGKAGYGTSSKMVISHSRMNHRTTMNLLKCASRLILHIDRTLQDSGSGLVHSGSVEQDVTHKSIRPLGRVATKAMASISYQPRSNVISAVKNYQAIVERHRLYPWLAIVAVNGLGGWAVGDRIDLESASSEERTRHRQPANAWVCIIHQGQQLLASGTAKRPTATGSVGNNQPAGTDEFSQCCFFVLAELKRVRTRNQRHDLGVRLQINYGHRACELDSDAALASHSLG